MPLHAYARPSSGPPVRVAPPLRRWAHLAWAVVVWVLFGAFWASVFVRTPPREAVRDLLLVAAALLLVVTATGIWIRHNRELMRRFGERRRTPREPREAWARDVLGRAVDGPGWSELQAAAEVEVDVDPAGSRKIYRAF